MILPEMSSYYANRRYVCSEKCVPTNYHDAINAYDISVKILVLTKKKKKQLLGEI